MMKHKRRIFLLSLLFGLYFVSCIIAQPLIPFSIKGKYGYINKDFKVIVEPKYYHCSQPVGDGFYIARKTNAITTILDNSGTEIFTIESPLAIHLTDDVFAFSKEKGYTIIKILHNLEIANNVGTIGHGGNGFFSVKFIGESGMCYLDNQGNRIFAKYFFRAYGFTEEVATVIDKSGYSGVINFQGEYIVKPTFRRLGLRFSEGLCAAQSYEKETGYIKKDGSFAFKIPLVITDNISETGTDFENGLALVQISEKPITWRIINKNGTYVSNKLPIDWSAGFSNQIALVSKNIDGKHRFGYIKQDGSFLYELVFENAESFKNGYARIVKSNRDGIIDTNGNIYWFDEIFSD